MIGNSMSPSKLASLPFAVAALLLGAQNSGARSDESAELFKHKGPLPVFRIEIDSANTDQMRRDPRRYAICTVHVGDKSYPGVGIHIKGAAGSTRPWDDKPALTLAFDKVNDKQRFRGLDKVHLNNSVQDPRYLNEILCSEMMLAAGVPTARATHCLVELNDRKVGLYVLKEGYDSGRWSGPPYRPMTAGFCKTLTRNSNEPTARLTLPIVRTCEWPLLRRGIETWRNDSPRLKN
jgi:hypothetical protein